MHRITLATLCGLVMAVAVPGVTLAQNPFASTPIWTGGREVPGATQVALGDFDRDGDLDLFARDAGGVSIFRKTGGNPFYVRAVIPPSGNIGGPVCAVGDVNWDGFVDVLVNRWLELFINQAGDWGSNAVWSTTPDRHYAAALVDLDEDGDLDVFGGSDNSTSYSPHVVYLNPGSGIYSPDPNWEFASAFHTAAVAAGDVDGDGDLDLVCGNGNFPAHNQLILNRGPSAPRDSFLEVVEFPALETTSDLALGDIDGDGDLDLVVANDDSTKLYLNRHAEGGGAVVGGVFAEEASWATELPDAAAVTVGDVDRDGMLDVIIGTSVPIPGQPPVGQRRLFLNQGSSPWFSGAGIAVGDANDDTQDVLLADADGDGDLDLFTAATYASEGLKLYLNGTPQVATVPDTSMVLPLGTHSLAAGDVNGDGAVDLVVGNDGPSYLYLADAGTSPVFPMIGTPVGAGAPTRTVALVDLDADGRLDLVLGNSQATDIAYHNADGTFTVMWNSSEQAATTSVATGDLDGDGRPDLLFGYANSANRVFLNRNGVPESQASWQGPEGERTRAVALADFDLDGDLDAVFGNEGQVNKIYLNMGAGLAADPRWSSDLKLYTASVAAGDVDNDGFPDLVCGNDGERNTLYLNTQGALTLGFNQAPSWSSNEADSTRDVALVDIDGDGDLDIMCGNADAGTACYLNTGGRFPPEASWRTGSARATQAVVLADFDADGDLDLVCGNFGQRNTVHYGRRQSHQAGDPGMSAAGLANTPTRISEFRVVNSDPNLYRLSLTVDDGESDPVGLAARFRYADTSQWLGAELDRPLTTLATSPEGLSYEFTWDVSRFNFDPRDVVLSLSTVPNPQRHADIRQTSTVEHTVGRLNILRPEMESNALLNFTRVTLGDTVRLPLTIANLGNADLEVISIALPADEEMRLSRAAPFWVAPGETAVDTVFLEPRESLTVEGEITIASNDPLTPMRGIAVTTDITGLTVVTSPLLEGDTAPLGDALTIQVIPDENVRVERGAVHYRRATGAGTFTDIELTPSVRSFIGVVPGHDVAEGGLEYYIELENSGVFATDPADTSDGHFYSVTVDDPSAINASARPSSGSEYLAGRAIRVDVVLPSGAEASAGHLHFRLGGQDGYATSPLIPDPPYLYGTIPDSLAGARGLEYWVEVQTRTRTLTDPATTPDLSPRRIPVTVPDLAEADVSRGGQFRMISVPLQFKDDFTGTLEALLFDQPEFGSYDPLQWRSFRWLPGELRYAELSEEDQATAFRPAPGRAFWLVCRQDSRITTAPITATSTPTDDAWSVELAPGWNQVGNSFAFTVAWDSVRVAGGEPRDQVVEPPVAWVPGVGYRDSVPALEPWQGYWVKNITDPPRTVVLEIPPREAPAPTKAVTPQDGWRVAIRASARDAFDGSTRLGCSSSSLATWDPADRSDPPLNPQRGVSVYFPHGDWANRPGRYTVDVREPLTESPNIAGHRWAFDVTKNFREDGPGNTVTLEFVGVVAVPAGLAVSLVDRELGQVQDLRGMPSYMLHLGVKEPVEAEGNARFVILIGDPDFVDDQLDDLANPPVLTTLHQNYPNPFNPETVIRWDVSRAGQVDLKIYDLTGALVRTVHSGFAAPGGHEFVWRGNDDGGRRVASGVYVYRLRTPDTTLTRRMTLVK